MLLKNIISIIRIYQFFYYKTTGALLEVRMYGPFVSESNAKEKKCPSTQLFVSIGMSDEKGNTTIEDSEVFGM